MSRTVVVTGSASGIGRATRARLEAAGDRVVGVDLRSAEIEADLGAPEGRAAAIAAVERGGAVDAVVCCAGVEARDDVTVRVNYFGVVGLLEGLQRPARRSALLEVVPMPLHGPGGPEHVASVLAWLAGPENVLVTGQVVFVDGGAEAVLRGESEWRG